MLCFGGSFNPIHHGHLICARAVAESVGAERVVLIPCNVPPHKQRERDFALAEDRLAMCKLAVEGDPLFEVSDLELCRPGPSYTIETVRELKRTGHQQVSWLIGADMLNMLPLWREPLSLMAEARLLVMARPGWSFDWQILPVEFQELKDNVIVAPLIEISATEIRRRVRSGLAEDYLMPAAVVRYVRERKLFL